MQIDPVPGGYDFYKQTYEEDILNNIIWCGMVVYHKNP
jgi:hypothetical protein